MVARRRVAILVSGLIGLALLSSAAPASPAGLRAQVPQAGHPPVALLRIPFPQDEGTLTPYTFELGYSLMTLVYDTLMWRDADGIAQPWLARSVDTSADGLRVTIELADNARWHDGAPLTSADVAFTFAYVRDHPHARFTPPLRVVAGVDTPGPTTVVLRLRQPSPGFTDQPLADLPILPAHIWSGLPAGALAPEGLAVGSGPYRLVEHRAGAGYRFEAEPSYFRGPPPVQAIDVPIIDSAEETFQALERSDVDMIPVTLSEETSDQLRNLGATVVQGPAYVGTSLVLNTRRPPFDRAEVRRAVAQALDLDRIGRFVGGGVVADRGYIHPESPWAAAEPLHRFDEAAARTVLSTVAAAGTRILVPDNDPVKREAGRQVGFALGRAGLRVEVAEVGRDDLAAALGENGETPDFSMAIAPITPLLSYDPDFLRRLFGSDPQDSVLNTTGYTSPALAEATDRIATARDPAARRAATDGALRILAADVPAVPLFFSAGSYAYRAGTFDGWVVVKGSGILDKRSFVEPVVKAPSRETRPTTAPTPANDDDGGRPPYGLFALGAVALAGALLVVALRRD